MAKFLFLYRSAFDVHQKMTPEEMQRHMEKWQAWLGEGFKKGWLLDAGDALKREGRVVNPKNVVTDGPFVESKEVLGGYSVVQAETLDRAVEFAKGCPALVVGGRVEVRPLEGFVLK
jgi:hypothetical protein